MFFDTKSHYTILSNYVTIFEVDAEMSEIFTDFSREKSQKNSAHWLQWVRNYWYLHFSPKLVMFLQGGQGRISNYSWFVVFLQLSVKDFFSRSLDTKFWPIYKKILRGNPHETIYAGCTKQILHTPRTRMYFLTTPYSHSDWEIFFIYSNFLHPYMNK